MVEKDLSFPEAEADEQNIAYEVANYLNRMLDCSVELTIEEECTLAHMVQAGLEAEQRLQTVEIDQNERQLLESVVQEGNGAKEVLVASQFRLLISIAHRYSKFAKTQDVDDLVQEGALGLWRATEKFNPRKASFKTYGYVWIHKAIRRALTDQDRLVRIQTDMQLAINRMRKAQNEAGLEDHQAKEIAELIGVPEEKVKELIGYDVRTGSYNVVINNDGEELSKMFEGDTDVEEEVLASLRKEAVAGELQKLPERSRHIIELRFGFVDGEEHPRPAIAKRIGFKSGERVRQLENEALAHLREEAPYLKEFL